MENWQHREAGAGHSLLKQQAAARRFKAAKNGTPMIGY
jgi:hypothetical protein